MVCGAELGDDHVDLITFSWISVSLIQSRGGLPSHKQSEIFDSAVPKPKVRLDVASGGRQHSLSFILWSILTTLTHTHLHQCSVSLVFISQRTPSGLLTKPPLLTLFNVTVSISTPATLSDVNLS